MTKRTILGGALLFICAASGLALAAVTNYADTPNFANATPFQIGGSNVTTSAAELNYNDITTAGTAQGSKAMVLSSGKTIASVTRISAGNYRTASTTASASGDISTPTLDAFQLWYVDTTSGAVDLDFGEDAALAAADVGQSWRFLIVAGTNALTISAGTSVSTVATSNLLGSACEDVGDFFECVPYTTTAVKCWSYCAD